MNKAAKKRRSYQHYPPFADNYARFFGVFPGLPPNLTGPASSPALAFLFPASICFGAGFLLFLKKEAKNKKLL